MRVLNMGRFGEPRVFTPTVVHRDGRTSLISNPTDFPDPSEFASGGRVKAVLEPIVKASIIVPESASFTPFIPPAPSRLAHIPSLSRFCFSFAPGALRLSLLISAFCDDRCNDGPACRPPLVGVSLGRPFTITRGRFHVKQSTSVR